MALFRKNDDIDHKQEFVYSRVKKLQSKFDDLIEDVKYDCQYYSYLFRNLDELLNILEDFRNEVLKNYIDRLMNNIHHEYWADEQFEKFEKLYSRINKFFHIIQYESSYATSLSAFENLLNLLPPGCPNLREDIISRFNQIFYEKVNKLTKINDIKNLQKISQEIPPSFSRYKNILNQIIHSHIKQQIKLYQENENIQMLVQLYETLPEAYKSYQEEIPNIISEIVSKKIQKCKKDNHFEELEKLYNEIPRNFVDAVQKIGNELLKHKFQKKKQTNTNKK